MPGISCISFALFLTFGSIYCDRATAQSAAAVAKPTRAIVGDWQGTLHAPQKDLRIVVKITKTKPGVLKVVDYSIDQGGQPIPATSASYEPHDMQQRP